jgi:hypothetical protein
MNKLSTLLFAAALACDGGGSGGGDKADADGFKQVPNINGIKVKVPDSAVPNGVGGAPGFHSDDQSFGFTLQQIEAGDSKDFDTAKKEAEELFFKTWIASEKTDDGWILTYEASKLDLSGDEAKEVGTMYSFEVRRKVGDTVVKCYGSNDKADGMTAGVEACKSLKAG